MYTGDFKDLSPSWSYNSTFGFYVVGKAMRVSEIPEDILDITKKIICITQDFFIPTTIKYILTTYSHDASTHGIYSTGDSAMGRSTSAIHRELSSEDRVSFEMLNKDVDSIETPANQIRYIHEIELEGCTKFVFKDGSRFVDGPIETRIISQNGISVKKEFITRLFWISISHPEYIVNKDAGKNTPAYYLVKFHTIARVYGEDSDLGKANRDLLRSVFKKLYANLNVYKIDFDSDGFSDEGMDFIAFGGDQYPQ